MRNLPFVSIVIPMRNEEQFAALCLDSAIANDYPKDKLEILVVDGISEDGTRSIVEAYSRQYPFIKLLDNPKMITPAALNVGISHAKGEILMRMDAHTSYPPDYVLKCITFLDEFEADNVGGVQKAMPRRNTIIARAIALFLSHPFGMGNAYSRIGSDTVRSVDTVYCGCWPKEVFQRIGLFDERLIRGQDREFNYRLRQAGGKILVVPEIVCQYFARTDLKEFLPWMFLSGSTPFYISKITRRIIFSWRNLVPPLFVLGLLSSLLLSIAFQVFFWLLLAIIVLYLVSCVCFSGHIAWRERDIRFMGLMPFIFSVTHLVYGVGSLFGIFRRVRS